jgi:hypothetical protein
MIHTHRFALAWFVVCALALGSPAASTLAATTGYSLNVPPSSFEYGCPSQGPCDCALVMYPTYGSFELTPAGSDPLYSYYTLDRYIASFNNGPGAVSITGSGTYKVGGEFALTQQMTLDLSVWGGPVQHFDSGVVPVSGAFPKIHAECAVHGFACYDTVITIDAGPVAVAGGPPPAPRPNGIAAVEPNPFTRTTAIVVALDRAVPVDVTVLDLAGRRVRALAGAQVLGATGGTVVWDGRRDDGRAAKTGVYWVRVRWPGGTDARRLIKIE